MNQPDEELLKPSRELIEMLGMEIAKEERDVTEKMERLDRDDDDGRRRLWIDFCRSVEPMRRQREAVIQQIVGYLALFSPPPTIIIR